VKSSSISLFKLKDLKLLTYLFVSHLKRKNKLNKASKVTKEISPYKFITKQHISSNPPKTKNVDF